MRSSDMAPAHLAPVTEAIAEDVERLLDLVFGYDRHLRTAYRLRERVAAESSASCVALDDAGRLVGSLQSWPLALTGGGDATPLWLVGPIAVHPDRRDRGIGRAMIARALGAIDRTALSALLIGDPEYYGMFGFSAEKTGNWTVPGPVERRRLLLRHAAGQPLPAVGLLGPRR